MLFVRTKRLFVLDQHKLPSNPRKAMEARDYKKLQWKIISISLSFSLIPLFALGFTIYYQFSVSYTAKVVDNLSTLAENRQNDPWTSFWTNGFPSWSPGPYPFAGQLKDEALLNKVFNIMQTRSKSYIDLGDH